VVDFALHTLNQEIRSKKDKMKFATSAFFPISLAGLFVFSSAQEEAPATSTPAIIGLHAGQTIPAFAAQDQFGRR
jgi:hypothetical protein